MKKILLFFIVISLFTGLVSAQERTIIGTVTSEEDNMGLPGVTVVIKGTTKGTTTDLDGKYSLEGVVSGNTLIFSFIGFLPQEVVVGDKNVINISMKVAAMELDEVVVTALGIKRQKRELGYSTEKLEGEVIIQSNEANVLSAIKGRAAGVQIADGDGVEGGSTRITIRGNNNISGNNQPLIVVDGVPMENVPGLTSIGRGQDWGSAINNINAFDIEDYNILKGGAASALYGSRGANGVIEIRTKRGRKQKGIGIQYNFTHKITSPYRFREVQDVYGHGGPVSLTPVVFPGVAEGDTVRYSDIYQYSTDNLVLNQQGETSTSAEQFGYYGSAVSWGPKMEGQMIKWWDGEMRPWSPQPENYKMIFSDGYTQTHNIAAMGGNEKGTARVSITHQYHKPIIENSDYKQITINLGTNLKISEKIRADVSLSYINYNRLNTPMIGESGSSFSKGFLYSWGRSYKGIDKDNYELPTGARNKMVGYPFSFVSPYLWWSYYNNNTDLNRDMYVGAVSLTYDITNWLKAFVRAGRDFNLTQFVSRNKPIDVIGLQGGYYANSLTRYVSGNYDWMLTATKDDAFNSGLNISFTFGGSTWNKDDYGIRGHSGTWDFPNMYAFSNYTENTYSDINVDGTDYTIIDEWGNSAGSIRPTEYVFKRRTNSLYGFMNLSFKDFLFLDLTGRNDWSSTLPDYANSYFYPSVSVSFIASEAIPLIEKSTWINFLKIRGGLAQTASDMAPYKLHSYYGTGMFGGEQTSYLPGTIPPFRLKPQRVNSYEAGVNLALFNNKIDVDFTYYYFYSFDQLLDLQLPTSAGASRITINEGVLTNKGIEILINTVPIYTNDFYLKTGINFTRNRNYVKSLGEYGAPFPLADIWGLNGPAMSLYEGDEYGTIVGYDHIYHENGQPMVNEAGTHYLYTDTRVPIGNASPDFLAGWYTEVKYKNFTLSTLVDTKWGGDIYCGSYVIGLQTGQSPETLIEREGGGLPYTDPDGNTSNIGIILDGVYEDGTPNDKVVHYYYKYLPNAGGWGKFISTPGILENTWVKLREVALTYNLPQKLIEKTKVFQSLKLSIVARNLFYIYSSLPDKINPEGIMGSGNAQGFEWASFPGTRSITFGVNANF